MRILIIHDRSEIGSELRDIALRHTRPTEQVDLVADVISARDKLRSYFYDLVVADLTLPVKEGKAEATLDNTRILLEEIFDGDLRTPSDVLGISRDPDILRLLRTNIGEHLMACLHEDPAGVWKKDFQAKLLYLISAKKARRVVSNSSFDIDLLIVTALDKEAKPYEDLFELAASGDFAGAKEFTFADVSGRMRRGVLYAIGQAGQPPCGSATQALLTQFRPKLVVMTGFCGGVSERVGFGDLVAFSNVAAWDYGKWVEVGEGDEKRTVFKPRPMPLNCPTDGIRAIVRNLIDEELDPNPITVATVSKLTAGEIVGWKVKLKGAGSGSAVVTSLETLNRIVDRDEDIWAIDMESYAFYYACSNTPVKTPDFICLKSVADHCNGEKDSKYHRACSTISAHFAHEAVTRHYDFDRS